MKQILLLIMLAVASVIVSCGGGKGNNPAPVNNGGGTTTPTTPVVTPPTITYVFRYSPDNQYVFNTDGSFISAKFNCADATTGVSSPVNVAPGGNAYGYLKNMPTGEIRHNDGEYDKKYYPVNVYFYQDQTPSIATLATDTAKYAYASYIITDPATKNITKLIIYMATNRNDDSHGSVGIYTVNKTPFTDGATITAMCKLKNLTVSY